MAGGVEIQSEAAQGQCLADQDFRGARRGVAPLLKGSSARQQDGALPLAELAWCKSGLTFEEFAELPLLLESTEVSDPLDREFGTTQVVLGLLGLHMADFFARGATEDALELLGEGELGQEEEEDLVV